MKAVFGMVLGWALACATPAQVAGLGPAAYNSGPAAFTSAPAAAAEWGAQTARSSAWPKVGLALMTAGTLTVVAGFVTGLGAFDPEAARQSAYLTLGGAAAAGLGVGILMWGPGDGWNLKDDRVTLRLHPSGRGAGLDVRF